MVPQFKTGVKMTDFQDGKLVRTDIEGKSIVIGKDKWQIVRHGFCMLA